MLYYHSWMFYNHFIFHFYIIFGTNLLTQGPMQIAVFWSILVFCRKGISNGVQTKWNLWERDFWNKRDPEDLEWTSRNIRGVHEAGVRLPPSWAPCCSTDVLLPPIYTHVPRKHLGAPRKTISTTTTFCIREIPSWSLHRRSAVGGIDHGGLLHQHHSPSDELWVVYHRPSGP